jgi:hypothetical protein
LENIKPSATWRPALSKGTPELIIDEQININNISQPEELPMYTTA